MNGINYSKCKCPAYSITHRNFLLQKPPRAKALPMSERSDGLREACPWRLRYTPNKQNQTITWSVGSSILLCPHQDRLPFCFKYTQASRSFITVTGSYQPISEQQQRTVTPVSTRLKNGASKVSESKTSEHQLNHREASFLKILAV